MPIKEVFPRGKNTKCSCWWCVRWTCKCPEHSLHGCPGEKGAMLGMLSLSSVYQCWSGHAAEPGKGLLSQGKQVTGCKESGSSRRCITAQCHGQRAGELVFHVVVEREKQRRWLLAGGAGGRWAPSPRAVPLVPKHSLASQTSAGCKRKGRAVRNIQESQWLQMHFLLPYISKTLTRYWDSVANSNNSE